MTYGPNPIEGCVCVTEACARAGVSRATLYRRLAGRRLRHVRFGSRAFVRSADLEALFPSGGGAGV